MVKRFFAQTSSYNGKGMYSQYGITYLAVDVAIIAVAASLLISSIVNAFGNRFSWHKIVL